MKTLLKPWFLVSCALWLFVYVSRHAGCPVSFLNNYLTDLLAVPVIANLALAFQRKFIMRSETYRFGAGHILFIVLYTSLVFEVLLPRIDARFTADWVDAGMYMLGGIWFWRSGISGAHKEDGI